MLIRDAERGIVGWTEINSAFPWMEDGDETIAIDISVILPPVEVSSVNRMSVGVYRMSFGTISRSNSVSFVCS
jgi:hypothetical protein